MRFEAREWMIERPIIAYLHRRYEWCIFSAVLLRLLFILHQVLYCFRFNIFLFHSFFTDSLVFWYSIDYERNFTVLCVCRWLFFSTSSSFFSLFIMPMHCIRILWLNSIFRPLWMGNKNEKIVQKPQSIHLDDLNT